MAGAWGTMRGNPRTLHLLEDPIVNAWRQSAAALALAGTVGLSGCTAVHLPGWEKDYPPFAQSSGLRAGYGTAHAIERVRGESDGIGVGAVAGAVVGGVIGHQIGEGDGNTVATVIGAAGGALIGHQIEKKVREREERYELTIRMEDGSYQSIAQKDAFVDLQVGDRLYIDQQGAVRRY